jgi:hypothetical protein
MRREGEGVVSRFNELQVEEILGTGTYVVCEDVSTAYTIND